MKKICCLLLLILPSIGFCFSWNDLWFTPNQQAAKLLKQNEPEVAAEKFSDPLWQGYANYKSGQFQKALQDFSSVDSPLANFNSGNTLVQLGQYQAALNAYDHAIQQQPNFADAIYNKSLLENFLKQQSSNNQNQQNNSKNQQSSTSSSPKQQQSSENQATKNETSQQKQQNDNNPAQQTENQSPKSTMATENLNSQQLQALNQWLQQIPDNPGGLLKQKFLRDHLRLEAEKNR